MSGKGKGKGKGKVDALALRGGGNRAPDAALIQAPHLDLGQCQVDNPSQPPFLP